MVGVVLKIYTCIPYWVSVPKTSKMLPNYDKRVASLRVLYDCHNNFTVFL